MCKITVFTPTYNRGYIINNLYQSLLRQTCSDFEWLVVDDGSTDNTEALIQSFINDRKIKISYIKTPNGGKHRAINLGTKKANGELFFIVDSDDFLADNALERVLYHYETVKNDDSFCGVCGLKAYPDGRRYNGEVNFNVLDCSAIEYRYKYNIRGGMLAEVFRTEILRQFPFPAYEGENFCSEDLVFDKIALKYKFRYFNEKIYYCDFLPDGLSFHAKKLFRRNPKQAMAFFSLKTSLPVSLKRRLRFCMDYWRYTISYTGSRKGEFYLPWWGYFMYPLGLAFFCLDFIRIYILNNKL